MNVPTLPLLEGLDGRTLRAHERTTTNAESGVSASALAAGTSPFWPEGHRVGGIYEIRRVLGIGGMAQVFEAWDTELARVVALKAQRADAAGLHTLREEAQALAAIRHPGVVTVHAVGVEGGIEYAVLERIYGVSLGDLLAQRLESGAPLQIAEILDLLIGLCDAVSAIHQGAIAHRDLKPGNVLVAPGGRVVVIDLGIFAAEAAVRPEGSATGTPHYMAPEAIRGQTRAGLAHLLDLYALGVVAFELLTGEVPFDGATNGDVLIKHLNEPVPDVRLMRPDTPPVLAALVTELLQKDPAARPGSMDEVAWNLRTCRGEHSQRARTQRFTVLLVDDDPNARILTEVMVRRTMPDAEVLVAQDGAEAVRSAMLHVPNLMLLDLDMPGMNGLEVCLALRGTHAADRISIALVSGRAHETDIKLLRELGVSRFVQKGPELGRGLNAALLAVRGRRRA